jgi:heme-degrading monooxygenase HmoA
MAIKVLIKRQFDPDKISEATRILIRTRNEVMKREGYIASETWRNLHDLSRITVVSMWESPQAWNAWHDSVERRELSAEAKKIMIGEETIEPYALGIPYQG